jgi:hypothetical protein
MYSYLSSVGARIGSGLQIVNVSVAREFSTLKTHSCKGIANVTLRNNATATKKERTILNKTTVKKSDTAKRQKGHRLGAPVNPI